MKYIYGKNQLNSLSRGQEQCYLAANRKGGYSSLTSIGSSSRNEHVLLMAAVKSPNQWVQFISNMEEVITVGEDTFSLLSQEYVGYTKNAEGFRYLESFIMDEFPTYVYRQHGIRIVKKIVMHYEKNLLLLCYSLENKSGKQIEVSMKPWMRFTKKGSMPTVEQPWSITDSYIESGGYRLYYKTDGLMREAEKVFQKDLYFADDAKDERDAVGTACSNHSIIYQLKDGESTDAYIMYSLDSIKEDPVDIVQMEQRRKKALLERAEVRSNLAKRLVLAADSFVVDRDSTGGRTIIAGYPFFGDWGRDTMIAVLGCCIAVGRKEDSEDIFRSFVKYIRRGIMPNMFPETDVDPMYNTVDASLLFIYAIYEYYKKFGDLSFVQEVYPTMKGIIEWYMKGTDFHIKMDEDGLISAGGDLEQLTWMDIRINGILPTPRHGKPVEINAYWYNDLKIMAYFSDILHDGNKTFYEDLAEKVRISFQSQFWNDDENCLKDVLSGTYSDCQVRLNQIWAISMPFSILSRDKEKLVVEKVYQELYTPYGLRSLSPKDPEFKPYYGGSLWNRDMAYHQGTVWAFPLGAYYLAYLKIHEYSEDAQIRVREELEMLQGTLQEGCVGQVAEIFDGIEPERSKGCFAQAWSVGELLRAVKAAE